MTESHPQNRRLGYARVSTYGYRSAEIPADVRQEVFSQPFRVCIEIGMLDASGCKHLHSELPTMVPTVAQRWLQLRRRSTNENLPEEAAEQPQRLLRPSGNLAEDVYVTLAEAYANRPCST